MDPVDPFPYPQRDELGLFDDPANPPRPPERGPAPTAAELLQAYRDTRRSTEAIDREHTAMEVDAQRHGGGRADVRRFVQNTLVPALYTETDAARRLVEALDGGMPLPRRWETAARAANRRHDNTASAPDHSVSDGELRTPQDHLLGLLVTTTSHGWLTLTLDPALWPENTTGVFTLSFDLVGAHHGPVPVLVPGGDAPIAVVDASHPHRVYVHVPLDDRHRHPEPELISAHIDDAARRAGYDPLSVDTTSAPMWEVLSRLGRQVLLPVSAW